MPGGQVINKNKADHKGCIEIQVATSLIVHSRNGFQEQAYQTKKLSEKKKDKSKLLPQAFYSCCSGVD